MLGNDSQEPFIALSIMRKEKGESDNTTHIYFTMTPLNEDSYFSTQYIGDEEKVRNYNGKWNCPWHPPTYV